jgi:hypothetical protein
LVWKREIIGRLPTFLLSIIIKIVVMLCSLTRDLAWGCSWSGHPLQSCRLWLEASILTAAYRFVWSTNTLAYHNTFVKNLKCVVDTHCKEFYSMLYLRGHKEQFSWSQI